MQYIVNIYEKQMHSHPVVDSLLLENSSVHEIRTALINLEHKIKADECKSPGDLTRTITLPPPDDGMRWSENKELPKKGQKYFSSDENEVVRTLTDFRETKLYVQIPIEPEKREYDWSKTAKTVLLNRPGYISIYKFDDISSTDGFAIADIWQAHDGCECPVDGESCIVEIRCFDQSFNRTEIGLASTIDWSQVYQWRFKELAKGVFWNLSTEEKKEC